MAEEIRPGTACGLKLAQVENGEDEDEGAWGTGMKACEEMEGLIVEGCRCHCDSNSAEAEDDENSKGGLGP